VTLFFFPPPLTVDAQSTSPVRVIQELSKKDEKRHVSFFPSFVSWIASPHGEPLLAPPFQFPKRKSLLPSGNMSFSLPPHASFPSFLGFFASQPVGDLFFFSFCERPLPLAEFRVSAPAGNAYLLERSILFILLLFFSSLIILSSHVPDLGARRPAPSFFESPPSPAVISLRLE